MKHQPKDHHYIPAFYLRAWESQDDGKLIEFRSIKRGQLASKPVMAKSTGFKRHLYTVQGENEASQDYSFETAFLKHIDDEASKVLAKIRIRDYQLNIHERYSWSRLITSLIVRSPQSLQQQREVYDHFLANPDKELEEQYQSIRLPNYPKTVSDLLLETPKRQREIDTLEGLAKLIGDGKVVELICNLEWSIIKTTKAKFPLLTSDRPVICNNRLGWPDGYLLLPIDQETIFLARPKKATKFSTIAGKTPDKIAKWVNTIIVSQAKEFVWASSNEQYKFIANRIGSAPTMTFEDIANSAMIKLGRLYTTPDLDV